MFVVKLMLRNGRLTVNWVMLRPLQISLGRKMLMLEALILMSNLGWFPHGRQNINLNLGCVQIGSVMSG